MESTTLGDTCTINLDQMRPTSNLNAQKWDQDDS